MNLKLKKGIYLLNLIKNWVLNPTKVFIRIVMILESKEMKNFKKVR